MSFSKRNIKYRNIKSYARTSTIIFTLFDAFITPRAGEISVRGLVYLLKPLGFSENAIRLVLSRMAKQGFVRSCRSGRVSYYALTAKGNAAVASGKKSTSEMETKRWDRTWYFVVYAVPEQKRSIRDNLRTVLKGLGYGSLGGSVWVSPYGFTSILVEQVKKLQATEYIETFRARYSGSSDLWLLAGKIWDIRGLSERYGAFMKKYQHIRDEFTDRITRRIPVEPAWCFAERFRVTTEYIDIALDDPMLPQDMLPVDWIGRQAKELSHDLKVLLRDRADEYVNTIMQQGVVRATRGRST